jgi:hypothetical protein
MEKKLENIMDNVPNAKYKVVEVTKDHYTLENGDVFEHTFDIDENITVEEFQQLLDNARIMLTSISNAE